YKVKVYERIDRFVLTRFGSVVCLTRAQVAAVKAAGVSTTRIRHIPNAIDVNRFPQPCPDQREELARLFPEPPRLLCCAAGRLIPEKGFNGLVRAAALVVRDSPDIGFILFGEGPTRNQLQESIHDLRLERRFLLAGFNSRLDRSLAACDLVAIPSYTEGMPNVL